MTICEWNGHKFEADSNVVRSFSDLQLSAEVETSDKAKDKYGYIERKKTKPVSVSMTALLYTVTGCDPQGESEIFLEEAKEGAQDYLYIGGEKLFNCQMMLTKASVSNIEINGIGQWVSCEVQLTFTQSTLFDGKTVKKTTTTQAGGTKKKSTFFGMETGTTTKDEVERKTAELARQIQTQLTAAQKVIQDTSKTQQVAKPSVFERAKEPALLKKIFVMKD